MRGCAPSALRGGAGRLIFLTGSCPDSHPQHVGQYEGSDRPLLITAKPTSNLGADRRGASNTEGVRRQRMELILLSVTGATFMLATEIFELLHISSIAKNTGMIDQPTDFVRGIAETLTMPATVRL